MTFGLWRLVTALLVLRLVQGNDFVCRLVQTFGTVAQFVMGAAAFFAGVGGELEAINGEHVAPDQALRITGQQDLAEQGFDLCA